MVDLWLAPRLARGTDAAFLLLRLLVGGFLIWGVWDNVTSAERMVEFQQFLTARHCPYPALAAPLSVYAQLICGALLAAGLLTRWAGLVMAFNFVVAVLLAHLGQDFREQFPALVLIAVSLVLATHGAGKLSVDAVLARRA